MARRSYTGIAGQFTAGGASFFYGLSQFNWDLLNAIPHEALAGIAAFGVGTMGILAVRDSVSDFMDNL